MANRLVLTLLALLTGLAAQIAPAQADVRSRPAEIAGTILALPVARPSRAPQALARLPEPGLRNTRAVAPVAERKTALPASIPVSVPADRARE